MPHFFITTIAAIALFGLAAPALANSSPVNPDEQSLSGNYLAGRTASRLRDNDLASDYFTRALAADSNNPLLIERIFLLELADGNLPVAEDFASRELAFNSQHRMARIVLGLRAFRDRHFAEARKNFTAASYTPVGELTSTLLTAWTYAGEGQLTPALKELDKLDANESFVNFKSFHGALIADYLGNAARAEAFYKKAYEQAANSLRIVQSYGNFLERHGRAGEAEKLYQTYLDGDHNPLIAAALADAEAGKKPAPFIGSVNSGAAEAMFTLASAMTDDQSIDVGLVYAQLAISFNATDRAVALTLLGDLYENVKRPDKAIEAYAQIPAASPLHSNAEIEVAVNLQRLERKDEAVAKLASLIAAQPGNFEALVTLGNLHRNNEDFAKAAAAYGQAIDLLNPPTKDNWRVFYYSGISYERLKQWDKAEPMFRRALELSPDEPMVLNYLGYSMIEKKLNLQEAMGMVKKAVELKPNDGYIVDSLAWAYYQVGDLDQALLNSERAVDLLPADPIIGEHLGDIYWKVGRKLEAKFQWQHAKDNKPEPDDLKRIEDKLKNGMPDEVPVTPAQNGTTKSSG